MGWGEQRMRQLKGDLALHLVGLPIPGCVTLTSVLTSLSLSFLICKLGLRSLPPVVFCECLARGRCSINHCCFLLSPLVLTCGGDLTRPPRAFGAECLLNMNS